MGLVHTTGANDQTIARSKLSLQQTWINLKEREEANSLEEEKTKNKSLHKLFRLPKSRLWVSLQGRGLESPSGLSTE